MRVALELEIPSDVCHIERVVSEVTACCADLALPPRALSLRVPVALTEALANAIRYGNRADATKRVRVRACVTEAALVLEVHDEGPGFDLGRCLHDCTLDSELEREDGRGLFLMQALMDRLEHSADGGSVVRMTMYRA
ncbi:MAG: ATP-binding protein [Gemmatimonadaceae bacterium]|jgi:anti-sigma regulatory factor (Ser/Thr protein kinase)|nr:ATP-binding protein [Gemmatimonadaceae bacterium]